jgi:type I restriction enzyme, S subunit
MGLENNIPEGWKMTFLSDITNYIRRGITPKYCENESVFVINQRCIRDNKVSLLNARFHDLSLKDVGDEKRLKSGDILICSTGVGTLGRVAQYKLNDTSATVDSHVTIVRPNADIFKLFLGLLLSGKEREIEFLAEGTTGQTELPRTSLGLLPINLPPLPEQKAIAKILTAFDDKIELLQAQNRTLETMAQTIFKEWFGKYQIGDELPEGWRVDSLSEIADFLNGLALQKYPPKKGYETLPVIKIRELKQGITSITDRANTEIDEKYIIDSGDVLFSWSGSLEVVIWQYGKGALNQHLFKVSSEIYPKWFYYHWVLHHLKEFKGIASSKATTMGHINRKHLDLAEVIIPDKETFKKLNFLFSPILEKIENNQNQLQSLTKTRDTLLPKLMSGHVRVNNIKQTADA